MIYHVVAATVEPSLLEKRISDAFDVFDNARSHEVDVRELGTIIRSLGISDKQSCDFHYFITSLFNFQTTRYLLFFKLS